MYGESVGFHKEMVVVRFGIRSSEPGGPDVLLGDDIESGGLNVCRNFIWV